MINKILFTSNLSSGAHRHMATREGVRFTSTVSSTGSWHRHSNTCSFTPFNISFFFANSSSRSFILFSHKTLHPSKSSTISIFSCRSCSFWKINPSYNDRISFPYRVLSKFLYIFFYLLITGSDIYIYVCGMYNNIILKTQNHALMTII